MTPLHKLYTLSGWLSGVFLVLICLLVVAQSVGATVGFELLDDVFERALIGTARQQHHHLPTLLDFIERVRENLALPAVAGR